MCSTLPAPNRTHSVLDRALTEERRSALLAELSLPLRELARGVAAQNRYVDVDDLHQIGLEAAWTLLPRYDVARGSALTFVRPRARGAMVDACRRLRREPMSARDLVVDRVDPRPTMEERMLEMEQDERRLARLSAQDRQLVRRCVFHGDTLREAAQKLGLGYPCAWARMRKILARMSANRPS